MKKLVLSVCLGALAYFNYEYINNPSGIRRLLLILVIDLIVVAAIADLLRPFNKPVVTGITLSSLLGIISTFWTIQVLTMKSYEPIEGISGWGRIGHDLINLLYDNFGYVGVAISFSVFSLTFYYFAYKIYAKRND